MSDTLHLDEAQHPITLILDDDLRRSRLTTFFRPLLAIPHIVYAALWAIGMLVLFPFNWLITLFAGRSPEFMHNFTAGSLRYSTRVNAYLYLATNSYPPFSNASYYQLDVSIAPRERQNRWKTFFRMLLVYPALLLSVALAIASEVAMVFCWITAVVLGRVPRGLRNLIVHSLRYTAQVNGYIYMLTDRYPDSDPAIVADESPTPSPLGRIPAALVEGGDLAGTGAYQRSYGSESR